MNGGSDMNKLSKFKVDTDFISVAGDFALHPGPRLERQGKFSGEAFRKMLIDRLERFDRITVNLDGTSGYGSSFLDEAFGKLITKDGMSKAEVRRRIRVISDEDSTYKSEIEEALELAEPTTEKRKAYA